MDKEKLDLLLLGPLQLSFAGKPVAGLVSLKAKALLAYLATERRPCPRSKLAGLLWSDLPEEDARRNLRVEIAKLRRWLGPYLVFTHQEAMLNPDSHHYVDLHAFELQGSRLRSHAPTSEIDHLLDAVKLYRADFLSGFQLRSAPLFDEWLLVERERLRQSALELLDKLVEVSIQHQDWKTGLLAARKSISIDSWREDSHRQLMTLLALSGDRSAALAQFEVTRRILVQELGIEPGPETIALYQRIKAGEVVSTNAQVSAIQVETLLPPHNLPAPTTSFVGRDAELEQLDDLLTDPSCRLLILTGPGGIGKTRLALEYCWKLVGTPATIFKDGIYSIPLAAVSEANLLASTMADELKLSISGSQEPIKQLTSHLRDKQMLLVLDNFEQLVEAAHLLVEILQAAPGIKLLVTSRHQLGLYEEWIFPVEGMPYPLQTDLPNWKNYSAVQLFQQRARRVNLRFSLDENRECVIRLCQLLEGLPLGIELAAAWVHVLPCENICRLIEQNLSLPENQIRNLPSRQRSLQAVFQSSWDLLSEDEQQSLAKMTVFQGGFSLQAAEKVTHTRPRLLANLAGKSLLRFSPDGRYEMHTLLYACSKERLAPLERDSIQAAHSGYYAEFLSDRAQHFSGPNEAQAIDEIAAEISNIRAGWHWVVAQISSSPIEAGTCFPDEVVELIGQYTPNLSTFYFRKSWFREAEPIFSQAGSMMKAAGFSSMPPVTRAPFVFGLVYLAHARHIRALGQNNTAHSLLTQGMQLLALYADSPELADAWHILGQIEHQTGVLAAAEEAYQHSLRMYRTLESPTGIASNLISLGVLAKNRGELSQAMDLYTECLEIFQQRGDQRGIWTCLINLGNIANVRQDYQEAKRLYDQAYLNVQHSADKSRQALTLLNLGSVAREVGETQQALQYYSHSLQMSEVIGEARLHAACLDGLGKTCFNQGNWESARDYLLRALHVARDANLLPQALDSLATLGRLLAQQQPQEAFGILAYVLAQPSCPDHVSREAEKAIELIKSSLPPAALAQAAQKFQESSLDAVIDSVRNSGYFLGNAAA